jgi:hypothetical protein
LYFIFICNVTWINRATFRIPLIFDSLQIMRTLTRYKADRSLDFNFGIVCDKHHGISYLYISFVGCRKYRKATNCWERDASQNLDRRQYRVTSVPYWISLGLRRLDLFLKKSKTHFGRYIFYIFIFLPNAAYILSIAREKVAVPFPKTLTMILIITFFFTRYYEEERKERKCLREKENVWERKEKDGACKAEREIIMLWSHGVMYCRENSWINFKLVQRLVLSSSIIYLRNCLCLVFHLHSRCPIFDFYLNNELIYLPLLIKLIRQNFRYFIDLSRAFYLINCPDLSTKLTCIVLWTCTWSSRFSINYLSDYQIIRIDNLLKLSDDRSSSRTFKSLDREFRSTSNVMQQTL